MKLREIKALIQLMQGTDVCELELVRDKDRVRITREGARASAPPQEAVKREVPGNNKEESQKAAKVYKTITSPMVGTFYRSSSLDTPPFVEEGSLVRKGQVICIIEAMKLMNQIESECDGKIISILVGNAQPVEFGEPLFLIEPLI